MRFLIACTMVLVSYSWSISFARIIEGEKEKCRVFVFQSLTIFLTWLFRRTFNNNNNNNLLMIEKIFWRISEILSEKNWNENLLLLLQFQMRIILFENSSSRRVSLYRPSLKIFSNIIFHYIPEKESQIAKWEICGVVLRIFRGEIVKSEMDSSIIYLLERN